MDIIECINTRRSVRKYLDKPISKEDMDKLIRLATMAPSGSGLEPWAFVVISDKEALDDLSERIKSYLLQNLDQVAQLQRYSDWFTKPRFHIFNRAHTLLIIYGNKEAFTYQYDCTLAAANVILAAHSMGIGTCWIGFSETMLNTPEFKLQHNVPDNFELVCPMSMGYRSATLNPPERKDPVIFYRDPVDLV